MSSSTAAMEGGGVPPAISPTSSSGEGKRRSGAKKTKKKRKDAGGSSTKETGYVTNELSSPPSAPVNYYDHNQLLNRQMMMTATTSTNQSLSASVAHHHHQMTMNSPQMVVGNRSGSLAAGLTLPGNLASPMTPSPMAGGAGTSAAGAPTIVTSPTPPTGRILGERVVEREIRIPKIVRTEETVERLQTTSEVRMTEEVVEETQIVKEKVKAVRKPIVHETVVEVPEIEYHDLPPKEILKIIERPQVTIEERMVEVPKKIEHRRVVEVVEVEYRDQPVERVVEIPEIREQVELVEKKVPQIVERETPEIIEVTDEVLIERHLPVPMEAVTKLEFELPEINEEEQFIDVPVFVPRFVEVACPVENLSPDAVRKIEQYSQNLKMLAAGAAMTLAEVDALAADICGATNPDDSWPQTARQTMHHSTLGTGAVAAVQVRWEEGDYQLENMECLRRQMAVEPDFYAQFKQRHQEHIRRQQTPQWRLRDEYLQRRSLTRSNSRPGTPNARTGTPAGSRPVTPVRRGVTTSTVSSIGDEWRHMAGEYQQFLDDTHRSSDHLEITDDVQ